MQVLLDSSGDLPADARTALIKILSDDETSVGTLISVLTVIGAKLLSELDADAQRAGAPGVNALVDDNPECFANVDQALARCSI